MKCKSLVCPECGEVASVLVEAGDLVVKDGELLLLQVSYEDGDIYLSFEESMTELDDFGECGDCNGAFRIAEFLEDDG
ncbi:MAG: hypothetical protein P4N59_14875 [Negativicutes bacterium]|nr:hypothetical protein [Negativicutes bacterium]